MSSGYAFFIVNKNGSFRQKIVRDQEEVEPDELDEDDEVIAKIPLSEKSLLALKALDAVLEIEKISGNHQSPTSFSELMRHLLEKSSNVSFILGRRIGVREQTALQEEIERLTSDEF